LDIKKYAVKDDDCHKFFKSC